MKKIRNSQNQANAFMTFVLSKPSKKLYIERCKQVFIVTLKVVQKLE